MVHVSSAGGRHKMLAFQQPTEPLITSVDKIITVNTRDSSSTSSSSSPSPASSNASEPLATSNTDIHRQLHIIDEEPAGSLMHQTNHLATRNGTNGTPKRGKMEENQDGSNGNANFLADSLNSNHNMNKEIMSDGLQLISHGLTESVCQSLKLWDSENDNDKVSTDEVVVTCNRKTVKTGIMKTTTYSPSNTAKVHDMQKHEYAVEEGSTNESNDSEDMSIVPSGESSCEAVAAIANSFSNGQSGQPTSQSLPSNKLGKLAGKPPGLKRVSFGSSKGSMVETLVYENTVPADTQKLSKVTSAVTVPDTVTKPVTINEEESTQGDSVGGSTEGSRPPSRVRVTFFESEKPLAVSSPESEVFDFDLSNMTLPGSPTAVEHTPNYLRQLSEGWDNPFRPDGDLSKEADQIVELIKEGKPINEETLRSKSPSVNESFSVSQQNQLNASPKGKEANGSTVNGAGGPDTVQHSVVAPAGQAAQVEHVVIKKKKGCCVVQ